MVKLFRIINNKLTTLFISTNYCVYYVFFAHYEEQTQHLGILQNYFNLKTRQRDWT